MGLIGPHGLRKIYPGSAFQYFHADFWPVYVDGVDLTDKHTSLRAIRQKVGMVFQYPEHRCLGSCRGGLRARNAGLGREVEAVRGPEMVGLDYSALGSSPLSSPGLKRRVAIAGVLAMKACSAYLDDPTAGLDPEGSADILSEFKPRPTE